MNVVAEKLKEKESEFSDELTMQSLFTINQAFHDLQDTGCIHDDRKLNDLAHLTEVRRKAEWTQHYLSALCLFLKQKEQMIRGGGSLMNNVIEKRLLDEWYKKPYPPGEILYDNITRILSGVSQQDSKDLLWSLVDKKEIKLAKAALACMDEMMSVFEFLRPLPRNGGGKLRVTSKAVI